MGDGRRKTNGHDDRVSRLPSHASRDGWRPAVIPLSRVTVTPEMKQAILDVVDSGRFILGPQVKAFEQEFARYIGVAHAIAVSQGTAAIQLAVQAIGVAPGDEVLVPSMTAFPTIEGVIHAGATP